ncbi:enoyl-CoA hydratase-related protein [Amycolatopsis thermoflava]|uniref:enoyl-CoA hydratase-related protein n=1 Tax=Amycolatopsis thermoflava TaxID=84480 RepID=UPI0036640E34
MRILLLCSAFNGLSQRAWTTLRARGHHVTVHVVHDPDTIPGAAAAAGPDLIICPFLRRRVPDAVWRAYRTIIIHPGPPGDRGPSSLDWAIMDGERQWGVTALQATGDLDAGPVWGSRSFPMPAEPPRKSTLYNAEVADAAVDLIAEVVTKAGDPGFAPQDHDQAGRSRPPVRQPDRGFSWDDETGHVLRRIRAADGRTGVHTTLAGVPVAVFDAHPGTATPGEPGTIAARRHGAVLVRTGDGAVWVGHARRLSPGPPVKLPAATVLGRVLAGVPEVLEPLAAEQPPGPREIAYRRLDDVGLLRFDFYNGAMSTAQCRRLTAAVRYAAAQDTRVLVLAGGEVFANGIHLGLIEAHPNPAAEAWRNITAINDLCREIITCTGQVVVSALAGGAGAGGVMLALGADVVLARDGIVLNPHYETMGLYGSEYWTYVLPRRVGEAQSRLLTSRCEPVSAGEAAALGMVDEVLPADRQRFPGAVLERAAELAAGSDALLQRKRADRETDEQRRPLETYRVRELAEMSHDIFEDRHGFAAARRAFLHPAAPAPAARRPALLSGG